jgi:hypothetical protein
MLSDLLLITSFGVTSRGSLLVTGCRPAASSNTVPSRAYVLRANSTSAAKGNRHDDDKNNNNDKTTKTTKNHVL